MKTSFVKWIFPFLIIGSMACLAAEATSPAVGQPAPDFSLMDHHGRGVTLSALKGKIVVLEWINPDCPFVQRHYQAETMKKLAESYRDKGVVWLAVNSTHYMNAENNRQWSEKYQLPYPILDDRDGKVGRMYGARPTPHMFIIDAKGLLAYTGAIDSDPSGSAGQAISYVAQALDLLLANKGVSPAETKPYGCSVKYAK